MAAHILARADAGLTLEYRLQRQADGLWYDFADGTFKATPTTQTASLPQSDASITTGQAWYRATLDSSAWADGTYVAEVRDTATGDWSGFAPQELSLLGGSDQPQPPSAVSLTAQDKTDIANATAAQIDVPGALTAQGLTTARAARLDNLDDTISSRSTYAGGVVAGVTAPVTVNAVAGLAPPTNWDKMAIDAAGTITSNATASLGATAPPGWIDAAAYAAGAAPPTATAIRQEMDANSTKLANLDAPVSQAGGDPAAFWAYLIDGKAAGRLLGWVAAQAFGRLRRSEATGTLTYPSVSDEAAPRIQATPSANDRGPIILTDPTLGS